MEYNKFKTIMLVKKQLLLLIMILLPMVAVADESGKCGDNLTWTYTETTQTLTIEGTGAMTDYRFPSYQHLSGLYQEGIRYPHL